MMSSYQPLCMSHGVLTRATMHVSWCAYTSSSNGYAGSKLIEVEFMMDEIIADMFYREGNHPWVYPTSYIVY